jgi:catechol 2,3-dioxygenase-like lactoylglutathione lyase family enzyme
MSESLTTIGAITMFIDDTQRSKAFYEHVFGAKAVYEDEDAVAFEFKNMVVNMLRVQAAHELIAPAPVGDADAPPAVSADDRGSGHGRGLRAAGGTRGGAVERSDGSRVGYAHRCVHRPRRPHLGGCREDRIVSREAARIPNAHSRRRESFPS